MSTPDEILRGLDPEQRRAATALHGPVCILAGACLLYTSDAADE